MKKFIPVTMVLGLFASQAFAQTTQVLRRARELSNQNNVRQGVPSPAQTQRPATPVKPAPVQPATPVVARPAATNPQQNIAKIQTDIAAIKVGVAVTAEQKQQLIKDIAVAVRGTQKPSLPVVTTFANSLTATLVEKGLGAAEQARLAQNIETVLNSATMTATQYDAVIADVQAILQVGGARRNTAVSVSGDLKAVGAEVRRK